MATITLKPMPYMYVTFREEGADRVVRIYGVETQEQAQRRFEEFRPIDALVSVNPHVFDPGDSDCTEPHYEFGIGCAEAVCYSTKTGRILVQGGPRLPIGFILSVGDDPAATARA